MDAHPPTTADYAYAASQVNNLTTQDCLVLIGWLAERVAFLESGGGPAFTPRPELPSSINGFGCIPRREEAVMTAIGKCR